MVSKDTKGEITPPPLPMLSGNQSESLAIIFTGSFLIQVPILLDLGRFG